MNRMQYQILFSINVPSRLCLGLGTSGFSRKELILSFSRMLVNSGEDLWSDHAATVTLHKVAEASEV